mmetsp:Transcript_119973/g.274898  ORF Transcript_119973/g.274898 Transcript_119973/m.274898 type:complete len:215 (+) Transcript_119973:2-646(+)
MPWKRVDRYQECGRIPYTRPQFVRRKMDGIEPPMMEGKQHKYRPPATMQYPALVSPARSQARARSLSRMRDPDVPIGRRAEISIARDWATVAGPRASAKIAGGRARRYQGAGGYSPKVAVTRSTSESALRPLLRRDRQFPSARWAGDAFQVTDNFGLGTGTSWYRGSAMETPKQSFWDTAASFNSLPGWDRPTGVDSIFDSSAAFPESGVVGPG